MEPVDIIVPLTQAEVVPPTHPLPVAVVARPPTALMDLEVMVRRTKCLWLPYTV